MLIKSKQHGDRHDKIASCSSRPEFCPQQPHQRAYKPSVTPVPGDLTSSGFWEHLYLGGIAYIHSLTIHSFILSQNKS